MFEPLKYRSGAGGRLRLIGFAAFPILATAGCSRNEDAPPSATNASASPSIAGSVTPPTAYPRGRWRLASQEDLKRTLLWIEHIVVTHQASNPAASGLRPLGWAPDPPNPNRTRAQALERARHVRALARAGKRSFEDLAREYSDDVTTRDTGGALGGVRAVTLPKEYLDALAVLRAGEISEIIETPFGYHLVKRLPVPEDERVAARRVLLRYKGIWPEPWRAPTERTRDAALALARRIVAKARSGERTFDALMAEQSEALDPTGDIGLWSLHDPEDSGKQLDALVRIPVGAVTDPIDSPAGIQIFERTPAEDRPRYAMIAVGIAHGWNPLGVGEDTKQGPKKLALQLSRRIAKDPSSFDALRHEHCCEEARQWTRGREAPALTAAVEGLQLGEIAKSPVEADGFFWIPKRIDPSTVAPPKPPLYELPSPNAPDLEGIIRGSTAEALIAEVKALSRIVQASGSLNPPADKKLGTRLRRLATSFERDPNAEARVESWQAFLSDLQGDLGSGGYEAFRSLLDEWATRRIMEQGR